MGVRRLFFRGGQILSGGGRGSKTNYLSKKHQKNVIFFSKKSQKTNYFGRPEGQGPPLALPCGRP